jgi:PPP family 3-phenylpropionic acid transporter
MSALTFIPSYILTFTVYAAITPYLSILVRDLGYSHFLVGLLLGIFEGAGIAGPFVFGYWADRSGSYRRGLAVSVLVPALVAAPLVLFIHPALSAGLLALAAFTFRSTTSLLDAVTTIQTGKTGNYGKIRSFGSLSFIVVLLLFQWTPVLKPHSAKNIAFWIAVTSLLSLIPVLLLPRTAVGGRKPPPRKAKALPQGRGPFPGTGPRRGTAMSYGTGRTGARIVSAYFLGGLAIIFLCRFAMAAVYTFFPLYITEELRWDAVGFMFALATAAEVPCMFISGRLLRRFDPIHLLALSAGGISLRLLIWAAFPFKGCIIAAQLLHSLCFGIFHPAAINFISTVFPPEKRAMGMSVYLALGSGLPSLIGNMLGGAIVETAGYRLLFAGYAAFTGAAIVLYFCMRLTGTIRSR